MLAIKFNNIHFSQVKALFETLPVREVKSNVISSMWITSETNESLLGKVINNKYKIDKYLGQGGFGIVFTVLDLNEKNT